MLILCISFSFTLTLSRELATQASANSLPYFVVNSLFTTANSATCNVRMCSSREEL